jgi:hypothetical protein
LILFSLKVFFNMNIFCIRDSIFIAISCEGFTSR